MSCYSQTYIPTSVQSGRTSGRAALAALLRAIIMIVGAFHEALEMRRAAYRRYRLSDE